MLLNPVVRNFKVTLIQHLQAPLSPPPGLSRRNPDETTGNLRPAARDRVIGGVTEMGRSEQARNAGEGKQRPRQKDRLVLEIVTPREPRTANGRHSSICSVGDLGTTVSGRVVGRIGLEEARPSRHLIDRREVSDYDCG